MRTPDFEKGVIEGRRQAFDDMMRHAEAITLGETDRPKPVYDLFMKAIEKSFDGQRPPPPSLTFSDRRYIAQEFISHHGADLFNSAQPSKHPPIQSVQGSLLDACRQIVNALDTQDEEELKNGYASARFAVRKAMGDG